MEINFIETSPDEVKSFFPEFYAPNKVFFEIMKDERPIGFYGIKEIGQDSGEISVFINDDSRSEITKKLAKKCLLFPSQLGFKKVMVSTEVKSIERFLRKMEKLGVKYLFENEGLHWFEVNYEL
jgi:hypothetical protein